MSGSSDDRAPEEEAADSGVGWRITRSGSPSDEVADGRQDPTPHVGGRDATTAPVITFLSDFGLAWGPVGVCHAVMKDIAPQIVVIDVSHGIPPFDVRAGAWVLASALPYTPVGVHLAVVDPGVGTDRMAVALRCRRGDMLVGPDNGLLIPAAERLGGIFEARCIANEDMMRHPVSSTFHGRDVFAPAAAALAASASFSDVGPTVEVEALVPAPWRAPVYDERRAEGEAVLLDSFGNIRTNLESDRWPLTLGGGVRLHTLNGTTDAPVARTFGEVSPGTLFVFEDSSGYICLAINLDSAGARLNVSAGARLDIERL